MEIDVLWSGKKNSLETYPLLGGKEDTDPEDKWSMHKSRTGGNIGNGNRQQRLFQNDKVGEYLMVGKNWKVKSIARRKTKEKSEDERIVAPEKKLNCRTKTPNGKKYSFDNTK